ncbi:MAG: RDD family protein [Haloarculaceae archaeon]
MAGYSHAPTREDSDVIGSRIVAQIIDNIIAFVLFFVILAVVGGIGGILGGATNSSGIMGAFGLLGFLLAFVATIGYGLLLEGFWDGKTVGKALLGIKVVKEDGGECDIGAAAIRNVLEIIDGLFYYVVGFAFMASSDKRQRLGDRIAGTVVVSSE